MQLASTIRSLPVTTATTLGATSPIVAPHRAALVAPARATGVAPAPAAAPAPLAGAIDGVARLAAPGAATTSQFIDFPGIEAGQQFDIVKGSKVGFLKVKGNADILRLADDGASFHVKAGAFGVKVDVTVDVERTGDDTVRISSHGSGIPDQTAEGRVVENRTDYVEFERIDAPDEHTIISHDGNGTLTIETVVPTFGTAHLVLARRD